MRYWLNSWFVQLGSNYNVICCIWNIKGQNLTCINLSCLTIFCQIDKDDEMERKAVTFATAQGSKAVGMYYISFWIYYIIYTSNKYNLLDKIVLYTSNLTQLIEQECYVITTNEVTLCTRSRLIIRCVNGDSTDRHSNSFHLLRHYNIFFKPGFLFRTFY
jgi:hypothetical protein